MRSQVDLTTLAVFSGAVGLRTGFGLQKVFSNLISGIILLLPIGEAGRTVTTAGSMRWARDTCRWSPATASNT
jgi:hypothetical protein